MNPPIVILTDFGTTDPYVGIMKGVITQIAPLTPIIDLTHKITPGDVRQGAVTLWQSINYFPPGSIFLVVIDPGVGTSRRPLILQNGPYTFIAPDNGVLSFICGNDPKAWEISNPELSLPNPSITFHGRDIFAPAAAHTSLGVDATEFGDPIRGFHLLNDPRPGIASPRETQRPNFVPGSFRQPAHQPGKIYLVESQLTEFHALDWEHNAIDHRP